MTTRALLLLVLLGGRPPGAAQAPAPLPPAERQFRAWLAAFNGGDRPVLLRFLESEYPSRGAGTNQQFQPISEGDGYYHFAARNSGKCVEAAAAATANGTVVQQNTCNGAVAQTWRFVATDTGHDKVQTESNTTQGWDVTGGPDATADGVRIQLWRNVDDVDQLLGFRSMTGGFGRCRTT